MHGAAAASPGTGFSLSLERSFPSEAAKNLNGQQHLEPLAADREITEFAEMATQMRRSGIAPMGITACTPEALSSS